jgi:putative hydrolase of the HAD superfamily
MTKAPIPCRAVFLDAGGVIVLPDGHLLADALARVEIDVDPSAVPLAHYRAVRALDRAVRAVRADRADRALDNAVRILDRAPGRSDYPGALFPQLGIVPGRTAEAIAVWERLADRARSNQVLWSEPTPSARDTIATLQRAGLAVVIVTNSDGHGAENLAASGFAGVPVIDSHVVGAAKPDVRIFEAALACAGEELAALGRSRVAVKPSEVVHVGDMLSTDVAGARAAGITPIHFDPLRACRATDHRHVRSLSGLWRHIASP